MSFSINRVTVLGNVGKDPEVRFTQAGEAIASFSIAASESWKDKSGNKQERTEWFNITAFGPVAKIVQEYVTKGSKVYVEGSLRTEDWVDKEGQKRRSVKVILSGPQSRLILLSPKSERAAAPGVSVDAKDPAAEPFEASDGDIPF